MMDSLKQMKFDEVVEHYAKLKQTGTKYRKRISAIYDTLGMYISYF